MRSTHFVSRDCFFFGRMNPALIDTGAPMAGESNGSVGVWCGDVI